jgi:hypothetical protein
VLGPYYNIVKEQHTLGRKVSGKTGIDMGLLILHTCAFLGSKG